MKKILLAFLFFVHNTVNSQTVIQMKREGGVSIIPCKLNGLPLSFIFDTGASDVSISLTEATFMFKNGYLNKKDIIGTSNYSDANGNISEGININLREIEIQGLKLYNVKASIVKNMDAPLLLGQSAISKLGVVLLDLISNTLTIITKKPIQSSIVKTTTIVKKSFGVNSILYPSVKIGSQFWMTKNLNVENYANGDLILEAKTEEEWNSYCNSGIGAWFYCDNNPANGIKFGKRYNWYAVNDPRGLAPQGYHVASEDEWTTFTNFLGISKIEGTRWPRIYGEKIMAKSGWPKCKNIKGNNLTGFTALPGGFGCKPSQSCCDNSSYSEWWCSTEFDKYNARHYQLTYFGYVYKLYCDKSTGCYVRCIKD
jgi:uncharacterized protein (TIGR02145 family)